MPSSRYEDARAIGAFVSRKVHRLQGALLGNGGASAAARASLARLRKLDSPGGGSWATAGAEIFDGAPDIGMSKQDQECMFNAIKCALSLYAFHQQSQQHPMALTREGGAVPGESRSFGWSCREIALDSDRAKGVVRRLSSVEGARDFHGLEVGLRGLIQLMRANDVPVDYYALARDIYLLQFDGSRSGVFMRWSQDFYSRPAKQGATTEPHDGAAGTSKQEEE